MTKIVDCGKVNPAAGCSHVIEAESEDELLRLAAEHAKNDHGMDPSAELLATVKSHIQDR